MHNSNNFSLTFSNLMENNESVMLEGVSDYPLERKRSDPNLALVVPAQISNIRP